MCLKASFIHVVSITSREAAAGDGILLPRKDGKMVWAAQPNPETICDFCANSKNNSVFFIKSSSHIILLSRYVSHNQCCSMTTLVPKICFLHGRPRLSRSGHTERYWESPLFTLWVAQPKYFSSGVRCMIFLLCEDFLS